VRLEEGEQVAAERPFEVLDRARLDSLPLLHLDPAGSELVEGRLRCRLLQHGVSLGGTPGAAANVGEHVLELVLGPLPRPALVTRAKSHVPPLAVCTESERVDATSGRAAEFENLASRFARHQDRPSFTICQMRCRVSTVTCARSDTGSPASYASRIAW
jgi:hypothetical protein